MNDIVDRLTAHRPNGGLFFLCEEAAAEIEKLREIVDIQDSALECRKADAEFFRQALTDIQTCLHQNGYNEALRITQAALMGNEYD